MARRLPHLRCGMRPIRYWFIPSVFPPSSTFMCNLHTTTFCAATVEETPHPLLPLEPRDILTLVSISRRLSPNWKWEISAREDSSCCRIQFGKKDISVSRVFAAINTHERCCRREDAKGETSDPFQTRRQATAHKRLAGRALGRESELKTSLPSTSIFVLLNRNFFLA